MSQVRSTPGTAIGENRALTRPPPEVEATIASRLGDMWLARTTLETDWAWRVAAFAARRGLQDEDIQAMLRGPLAMPDVSALVSAVRGMTPEERATASGPGVASAGMTEERDQERPTEEVASADNEAAREEDGSLAAVAPTADAPGNELLSEQVVLLSRGDGTTEDTEAAACGAAQEPTA